MLPPEESSVWVDRIIKFGALLVTSPIWIRILKAMFHEIQSTLRDEGGLFGKDYWSRLVNWDLFVEEGTISPKDLELISYAETAQECWQQIKDFYQDRAGEALPRGQ